ncbi:hypothetical protein HPB48_006400 [Haemaphysalis longicornis]|uniref:Uncharacterized protein n=1 Tax=Haemaphysalis longicornis TaxID=44386 RepID=A0A9J6FAH2_HAELO|nr:hypothetical protein HPB48_006400 [Haemaphysalis longicornis]
MHTLSDSSAISIDVEDLFFWIPHIHILPAVKEWMTLENDEMDFKNTCRLYGAFVFSFKFFGNMSRRGGACAKVGCLYWHSSGHNFEQYISCKADRVLDKDFNSMMNKVFRYGDDYLVIFDKASSLRPTVGILRRLGLNFTVETLKDGCIQCLDLSVQFGRGRTCWVYVPR